MDVSLMITTVLLALATGIDANVAGQMNVLTQNLTLELFNLTTDGDFSRLFAAQLDLDLRPSCPSCHPSYNYIIFDEQVILPASGMFLVFTFLSEEPYVYTQTIPAPDCEPLSIVRSSQPPNLLFLDCRNIADPENYFLAHLERTADEAGQQWLYQKLRGYDTHERAGAYVEVFAMNTIMMLYVREEYDYIEINGPTSGYITYLSLPSECEHILRISLAGRSGILLLECSAHNNLSQLEVTNLHTLDMSSGELTFLLNTDPYSLCPVRFSSDGEIAAIFTQHLVIVIDMITREYMSISTSGDQVVYDGLVTDLEENSFYVIYSTSSGLHRALIAKQETGSSLQRINPLLFEDSGLVCAHQGCSLLALVDSDTLLVALHLKISMFSISGRSRVAPDVRTKYQPSRIFFRKSTSNTSNCSFPDSDGSIPVILPTATTGRFNTNQAKPNPTTLPTKESVNPEIRQDIDEKGAKKMIIIPVVLVAGVVGVATGLLIGITVWKRHSLCARASHRINKLRLNSRMRYDCSSDIICLLPDTPPDDQDRENTTLAAMEAGKQPDLVHEDDRGKSRTGEEQDDLVEEITAVVGNETLEGEGEGRGDRGRGGGGEEEGGGRLEGRDSDKQGVEGKEKVAAPVGKQDVTFEPNSSNVNEHTATPPELKQEVESSSSTDDNANVKPVYIAAYTHIDVMPLQATWNGRSDGSQEQVVGSLTKETQDTRDCPDGSSSPS